MASEPPIRLQITMSNEVMKRLKLWAGFHGKSPATFAGQIISSRVEANISTINSLIDEVATLSGVDRRQVIEEWLAAKTDKEE